MHRLLKLAVLKKVDQTANTVQKRKLEICTSHQVLREMLLTGELSVYTCSSESDKS